MQFLYEMKRENIVSDIRHECYGKSNKESKVKQVVRYVCVAATGI